MYLRLGSAIYPVLPAHLQPLRGANVGRPDNRALCVLLHGKDVAAGLGEVNVSDRPHHVAASEAARQWRLL